MNSVTVASATEVVPQRPHYNEGTAHMGKPPASNQRFNRAWFLDRMRAAGVTQRAIADRLGRDESAVHRLLHGRRNLKLAEAAELARMLGVSYDEVVEQAGVSVPDLSSGPQIAVRGWVDSSLTVHAKMPQRGPRKVPTPYPGIENLHALRVIAPEGSPGVLALDGAVLYYQRPGGEYINPDALGKLSVVETAEGATLLRVVRRGYERGSYSLASTTGEVIESEQDVRLNWASPVLFVKLD